MDLKSNAVDILSRDIVSHIDMLQAIERNNARLIYAQDGAVLLYNISGQVLMLSAEDSDSAMRCIEGQDEIKFCVAHGKAAINALSQKYKLEGGGECIQCAYLKSTLIPLESRFSIRQLTVDDKAFVLEHYQHDPDYIEEILSSGIMHGAQIDGKLAGFIGMHDEGSIGLLEVLPEYRRKGVATFLQSFMINLNMRRGWIPYGQVYLDNSASFDLQHHMGMELSSDVIQWMYRGWGW